MTPIEWANAIVTKQGWLDAFLIARKYNVSRFVVDGSEKNQHEMFYRNACGWMRKRLPADVVNRLSNMGIHP